VWGWLIAVAVVARVIYVAAVRSDRARSAGPSHSPTSTAKSAGWPTIVLTFFGVALGVYGLSGLLLGEPDVLVIAMVLLGLGWLLVKKG